MTSTSLPSKFPRYYTPGQVAAWAGVTSMTIIRWCDAGILRAMTTPGGHRRITEEPVKNYLVERGLPIPPELGPKEEEPPPRVLVIEDDARALRALVNRFKKFIEVTSFTDGYKAMASACADPPTAILLDMLIPEVNGEKMIRALREQPRTAKLPIIAWSHDEGELEAARRAGATHVFSKDDVDDVDEVLRVIAEPLVRVRRLVRRQVMTRPHAPVVWGLCFCVPRVRRSPQEGQRLEPKAARSGASRLRNLVFWD